jgi:hypothetical protein
MRFANAASGAAISGLLPDHTAQGKQEVLVTRTLLLALGLAAVALTTGCNDKDRVFDSNNPPHDVEGVYSVTGDQKVTIYWRENQDNDIDYYKVYRNNAPTGTFTLIGNANQPPFVDTNVTNGSTYFYAVSAVDNHGEESVNLSYENVFDTPRPEGSNVTLTDASVTPATAGWDFSAFGRVSSTSAAADIYFDASSGALVYAGTGVKIQDAGLMDLVDVDFGPPATDGWSADGIVEAIPGHSYIVLTANNHYAKFEVVSKAAGSIVIDWAYQIDPDNPELAPKIARNH